MKYIYICCHLIGRVTLGDNSHPISEDYTVYAAGWHNKVQFKSTEQIEIGYWC